MDEKKSISLVFDIIQKTQKAKVQKFLFESERIFGINLETRCQPFPQISGFNVCILVLMYNHTQTSQITVTILMQPRTYLYLSNPHRFCKQPLLLNCLSYYSPSLNFTLVTYVYTLSHVAMYPILIFQSCCVTSPKQIFH